ncbi:hypothetical protein Tco_0681137 [Tanacetum coccineum]|uniref:Uncharacterized protein n=1 Tax=Tanacetum coccineum TaxID=301880 RepID=A0ABQ4XNT4_9ASTR
MKTTTKASKDDFILKKHSKGPGEGSGVIPEVPDGPSNNSESSSSESEDEERFLSADDEAIGGEQAMDEQAGKVPAEVSIPEPQVEKPGEQLLSSILTLSSTEYGNQFINDNPDVLLTNALKDPAKIKIQSMVDVPIHQEDPLVQRPPLSKKLEEKFDDDDVLKRLTRLERMVEAMSKINHTEAIEESVQANVMNEKNPINLFPSSSTSTNSLTEYELKSKLYDMMLKNQSFLQHDKHLELYNALISSIGVDEAISKGELDPRKRHHDDEQDPHADSEKEKMKKRRKDIEPSKQEKDQAGSSKKGKAPSKTSKTDKIMNVEELVKDVAMDAKDMTRDDAPPIQGNPQWFKQDAVVRPETHDPEWYKEPNAHDEPKQTWFNELVNADKNQVTFDDLMSFTVDFIKFNKHCLKKDKIIKADLEGPTFSCGKPEGGDRCSYDLSKPLPLQGPPGCTTIPVDFFSNKDLEYLKTGNTEKKYASSLTKLKAARYELEGLEEMILKL